MSVWIQAAIVAGALGLLAVCAVGGALLVMLFQGVLLPKAEDAKLRADVQAVRLEHDKLLEQILKWNKKRGPVPEEQGEFLPVAPAVNGRQNRLAGVRSRWAVRSR